MVAAEPLNTAAAVRRWSPAVASATAALRADEPCGDAAVWIALPAGDGAPGGCLLAIVDGLGHGVPAALAAAAAVRALGDDPAAPLPALMERLDAALAELRGAAVGLVRVEAGRLLHAGIGNTRAARLRDGAMQRLPSQNGIVGGRLRHPVAVTALDLRPGDWLLLSTDGIDERIGLPVQLPEWRRDPTLLCLYLLEHGRLGRDDAGVLAMSIEAG